MRFVPQPPFVASLYPFGNPVPPSCSLRVCLVAKRLSATSLHRGPLHRCSPHLLRGVTHFTSGEQIPLSYLLDALRQMPALTHFTLQHCSAHWQETDVPRDLMVDIPHLTNLVVRADSPRFFVLLNEHLSLPKGAKRLFMLHTYAVAGWDRWARWFATFTLNHRSREWATICLPLWRGEGGFFPRMDRHGPSW
jgi:hypothetical protein